MFRWSVIVAAAIAIKVVILATSATPKPLTLTPAALARITCGVERWPVKTLADPGAPKVRLKPKATKIDTLRKLAVRTGVFGERGLGPERTTYRVKARLIEFKAEADGDVHLVIADPKTGGSMIAEFPGSACTHGSLSGTAARMLRARAALVRSCGLPSNSRFHGVIGTATITGVGFFDMLHGQTGGAPNGLELHPVLTFKGRCT